MATPGCGAHPARTERGAQQGRDGLCPSLPVWGGSHRLKESQTLPNEVHVLQDMRSAVTARTLPLPAFIHPPESYSFGLIFSCWYLARTKCRIPAVGGAVGIDKQWPNSLTSPRGTESCNRSTTGTAFHRGRVWIPQKQHPACCLSQ